MPGTVTVACKHPPGMILRLFKMIDVDEPVLGGGMKTVKRPFVDSAHPAVMINGPGGLDFGIVSRTPIEGGYALTYNVDADFFAEWTKQNAKHEAVLNKMIFAWEKPETTSKIARENEKRLSGLQPIAPDTDLRRPKPGAKNVGLIGTEMPAQTR